MCKIGRVGCGEATTKLHDISTVGVGWRRQQGDTLHLSVPTTANNCLTHSCDILRVG